MKVFQTGQILGQITSVTVSIGFKRKREGLFFSIGESSELFE